MSNKDILKYLSDNKDPGENYPFGPSPPGYYWLPTESLHLPE